MSFFWWKMLPILIVDDDIHNLALLKALGETMGHSVVTAESAYDAWRKMQDFSPSLILLDLRLSSDYDGWQFAHDIRQSKTTYQIPIIAISVVIHPNDQKRAKEAGCNLFLPKPFHVHTLRKYIEQFLPTASEL